MKRNYEMPELKVQKFDVEDIVTASGTGTGADDSFGGGGNED